MRFADAASINCPRQAAWKKGDMQRTSSCAANSRCSRPTTSVMIEEVRVLCKNISDRSKCLQEELGCFAYLFVGFVSSVGGLRVDLSVRCFETACSRKEDFFVPRRLREKLSVCDLLTFLLNILGRYN